MSKRKGRERRPMSPLERRYVEENANRLSVRKIASELGRPTSTVGVWVKDAISSGVAMPAGREGVQKAPVAKVAEGASPMGRQERLAEVRDRLHDLMLACDQPRDFVAVSREYRATLDQIGQDEGRGAGVDGNPGGNDDGLAELLRLA